MRPSWLEPIEYCRVHTAPTSPVLAKYSNLEFSCLLGKWCGMAHLCPLIWYNCARAFFFCGWTRCSRLVVLWAADGPMWFQGARPAFCWCASSCGSLRICIIHPGLGVRLRPSIPCVSMLSRYWLVFPENVSLQILLRLCRQSSIRLCGSWCSVAKASSEWSTRCVKGLPAWVIVWSVPLADWCSKAKAVAHLHPSQCTDHEVLDIPSSWLVVVDAYDVDIDGEDN